ncbi:WAP four-disulfide core domain protein 8 [Cavia porcellus]|uniref:WAP four-disulfide core domain protein 8 n=1 Tax=Cavia porcellus TaxID=10141 RepID=UPI00022B5F63|nr:WAP four-disulfide core domain protein 8 [Cavia porcellus]
MTPEHLPLQRLIFSWRNLTLWMLVSLSLEQTSASYGKRSQRKPGMCPQNRFNCSTKFLGLCKTDYDCSDSLKCCFFACENRCMDPYQEPCMLPLKTGNCQENLDRWYFDLEQYRCQPLTYSGCNGNANNFFSQDDCQMACLSVVREGQCPLFPSYARSECPPSCKSDVDCFKKEKCCESSCGFVCAEARTGKGKRLNQNKALFEFPKTPQICLNYLKDKCFTLPHKVKAGVCPEVKNCHRIRKPRCLEDADCPLTKKCCPSCGLRCVQP